MVLSSLLLPAQWLDPLNPLSIAPYNDDSVCHHRKSQVGGEVRCPQVGDFSSMAPTLTLSPAMMMPAAIRSPFDFPMREGELPGNLIDLSRSAPPESSQFIVSPQEAKVRHCEDQERHSPRAVVAGRLGELAIRARDDFQIPDRNLHQTFNFPILQANCFPGLTTDLHGSHDMLELQPSATAIERSHSPNHHPPTSGSAVDAEFQSQTAEPSVDFSRQSLTSPRKKRSTPASAKIRSTRGSPPLPDDVVEDLLTWNDSEITGHNPTDPDDDGYGINGIGFKPTAAIAWVRSQKRQKQVAEWKHREAREARERRRERRNGNNELDKLRAVQSGAIQKKVKFEV